MKLLAGILIVMFVAGIVLALALIVSYGLEKLAGSGDFPDVT